MAWGSLASLAAPAPANKLTLLDPSAVRLSGPLGQAQDRGIKRLGEAPFTADWLLADVSFKMDRIFTNYSGDASGRFIELAALTSPRGQLTPSTLGPVIAAVASYQKPDGHFGLDVDLTKPLTKLAPPIPMLWGNARMLVGLVTAARELNDPKLLEAAKRLGDFYVNSAKDLCAPARLAEYKASGTYGDGYMCCYFPAIEGLVLLYRDTSDPRYLEQARRMAEFFQNFDVLPVDHSHGNLCAWRGILELYGVTGERAYLDRAVAKWNAAVRGGYVWSLGGIGEHWYTFYEGDEGCSESDWLRFNLDLWRFTKDARYLDMAERLLANQYLGDQCPNGGYGMRHFDGDASGPIATRGAVDEWAFCCSFHGPLGLHFLKAYLAAGSDEGVFVNFPLEFTAPVHAGGRQWSLAVRKASLQTPGSYNMEVSLTPATGAPAADGTLWIRVPDWALNPRCQTSDGQAVAADVDGRYLRVQRSFAAENKLLVLWDVHTTVEGARFQQIARQPARQLYLTNMTVLLGPHALFASPVTGSGKPLLLATSDVDGRIGFLTNQHGTQFTVALPASNLDREQILNAIAAAEPVALMPWPRVKTTNRVAFLTDLVVVPAEKIPLEAIKSFTARLPRSE